MRRAFASKQRFWATRVACNRVAWDNALVTLPLRALAVGAVFLSSCKSGPPPLEVADGCQPLLAGADCLLPYPSDYFLIDDAAEPSGRRVQLPAAAQIRTKAGGVADVNLTSRTDGFSRVNPIVFVLPADPSPTGTVRLEDDPARSLDPAQSNTLIVEEASGEPLAHFVDLDPRATDGKRRAVVLHPYVTMKEKTRYAVFVQRFADVNGAAIAAPEGFRRVRDDDTGGQGALEPMRVAWKDRLAPLAKRLKLDVKKVQLAWEFTTGSQEWATADMLRVRELTMAWLVSNTPTVTVDSVDLDDRPETWKVVKGKVTGPLFMENADPGAKLHRDAGGQVAQNGTVGFDYVAVIPASVRDQYDAGGTYLYGHGFFGSLSELTGSSARNIANNTHRTMLGCEWWGMSLADVGKLGDELTSNPSGVGTLPERVHQAMANWIVLSAAVEKVMPTLGDFQRPASGEGSGVNAAGISNAGQPVLEASAQAFLGISQGHILGGTMCTLNPYITRCSLQMGGVALTSLMMRALPFQGLFQLLEIAIDDPLEQQKFLATMQRPLDRIDGSTWAQYTLTTELPGSPSPPRHVLMQMGLGDAEVPNLGTFMHARLLGLPVMQPSPVLPYGLKAAGATEGSALEIADYGIDTAAFYRVANFPEMNTPVHEDLRTRATTQQQIEHFWETGEVQHFCSGTCDPE